MERVGLIPAAIPNWEDGVTLEYEYRTSIITSRDGTEQRIALRQQPRVSMQYAALMRPERIYRHYADMAKNQDQLFTVPQRWKSVPITASTAAVADPPSDSTITVDAVPYWAFVGAAVVVANADTEEATTITAINSTELTVAFTITEPTTLYRAATGRFEQSASMDAPTAGVWRGDVNIDLEPGQIVPSVEITPDTFEGTDLWLRTPNWRDGQEIEFTSERETLDHGIGVIDVRNPRTYITETIRFAVSATTAEQVDEIVAFFMRQKGKRGEFYMPTHRRDMAVAEATSAGAGAIVVPNADIGTYLADSPVYNVLRIGGQVVRVTGMSVDGSGTTLTLQDTLAADITPDTKISWCPLVRFAADRLEVAWLTDSVAEMAIPVRTLPNDGGV